MLCVLHTGLKVQLSVWGSTLLGAHTPAMLALPQGGACGLAGGCLSAMREALGFFPSTIRPNFRQQSKVLSPLSLCNTVFQPCFFALCYIQDNQPSITLVKTVFGQLS